MAMNPRIEARLEKVKRISRSARRACYWLMAFALLAAAITVVGRLGAPESLTCEIGGVRGPCSALSSQAMTLLLVSLVGSVALVLVGLYRLAQLFGNYARGEIFTRGSVRELRMLSYVAVAYAVLQFVLFVGWMILGRESIAGWPQELRFDLPLAPVALASFITLLSWIMDVGAEIREENELTV